MFYQNSLKSQKQPQTSIPCNANQNTDVANVTNEFLFLGKGWYEDILAKL